MMRPYFTNDGVTIYHGDCLDVSAAVARRLCADLRDLASLLGPAGLRRGRATGPGALSGLPWLGDRETVRRVLRLSLGSRVR